MKFVTDLKISKGENEYKFRTSLSKVRKCSSFRKMEAIGFEIDPTIDVVVVPTQWPVQSSTGICAFIVYSDCKMLPQGVNDFFV